MKISNTINPFDMSNWQSTSDLTLHSIFVQNQEYEVKILSDSLINDVVFIEDDEEFSFNLKEQTGPIGYTEIYVDKNIFDDKVSVSVDGIISDSYILIEDTTTNQQIISISYLHPVNSITVSSDTPNYSTASKESTKPVLSFVDTTKDPQSYIDRYNNDDTYQEWFDSNYPDYTIKEATGFTGDEIPSWVKNNAGWWAEGLLTEDDFLKGIEYLLEQQIIRVN